MTDFNSSVPGSVLIVDDDPGIRRALGASLAALGYKADEATSGEHRLDLASRRRYDAILLDINMPGKGGIETCRDLRRELPAAGILMVTVRDSEDNKVAAFDAAADDFITKPFVMPELTARLRAIRRGRSGGRDGTVGAALVVIGEIALHRAHHSVMKAGKPIHLPPREFDVLEYLMTRAGLPVRHRDLLCEIWGPAYGEEVECLRNIVRQLRRKIETMPGKPVYVMTDSFVGYRFRGPDPAP